MAVTADRGPGRDDGMRVQLVGDAGTAILALPVTAALSIYKPCGLTRYGQRVNEKQSLARSAKAAGI